MPFIASVPPPPDDREFLAFQNFWKPLTLNERIAIVKSYRPNWTVCQIAEALACCERTILRAPSYQKLRALDLFRPPARSKYRGRTRRHIGPDDGRGFSNPDDPQG